MVWSCTVEDNQNLLEGALTKSLARITFESITKPAGFDVRRHRRMEGNAALGGSRSLDANYLRLFRMTKKAGVIPSPVTDEGLTGSGGTRLVGEGDEVDLRK